MKTPSVIAICLIISTSAAFSAPVPDGSAAAGRSCYDISPKQTPSGETILLDRCSGATWFLIESPTLDAKGNPGSGVFYQWDPIITAQHALSFKLGGN